MDFFPATSSALRSRHKDGRRRWRRASIFGVIAEHVAVCRALRDRRLYPAALGGDGGDRGQVPIPSSSFRPWASPLRTLLRPENCWAPTPPAPLARSTPTPRAVAMATTIESPHENPDIHGVANRGAPSNIVLRLYRIGSLRRRRRMAGHRAIRLLFKTTGSWGDDRIKEPCRETERGEPLSPQYIRNSEILAHIA